MSSVEYPLLEDDPDTVTAEADRSEADRYGSGNTVVPESDTAAPAAGTAPRRVRPVLAGVLAAAVCAGAGFAGWRMYSDAAVDRAASEALETASNYAVTLTSIQAGDIDRNFSDVLAGATGEFLDMYSRSSSHLKQMLVDNNATSTGTVVDAAVRSATADEAVVLLFVDQTITNTASPEPRVDRSRVVMTLDKVDGRWLVSRVDLL
ncbi:hypothetical protein [Rhodococcus sp. O3]|uniref:hypothetical protein n=1 Tax=Rhodococcus sp. O3 TaxID=3404919 RepID=UPI003B67BCDC